MKNLLLAFALFAAIPACAAQGESTGSADQNITDEGAAIQANTILQGSLAGGQVHAAYNPTEYPTKPFLAFVVPASEDPHTVTVAGNFPGSPDVKVVDRDFNVVAATQGVASSDGKTAKLALSHVPAGALLLVRDEGWVQPMEFDVAMQ